MYIMTPVLKTSRHLLLWNTVRYTFRNLAVLKQMSTTKFSRYSREFHYYADKQSVRYIQVKNIYIFNLSDKYNFNYDYIW